MSPLLDFLPAFIPWLFLFITICSVFTKPNFWPFSLMLTLVFGLFYNAINLVGLGVVTLLCIMAFYVNYSASQPSNNASKPSLINTLNSLIAAVVIMGCIALAAHLLPGFNNLLILNNVEKSITSIPFTLYFNFDKPFVLFILLIMYPTLLMHQKVVTVFKIDNKLPVAAVVTISFIVIFTLALILSLITFEPQLPSWWWIFAINNLLLTCVVEEVFFRGFIQQKLTNKFGTLCGLSLASCLFGLAHFAGGFNYVLIATLAGLLYGYVYLRTGKIGYAIFIHFCLNMAHLSLFTYPLNKV